MPCGAAYDRFAAAASEGNVFQLVVPSVTAAADSVLFDDAPFVGGDYAGQHFDGGQLG